jgi:hypothetical protein
VEAFCLTPVIACLFFAADVVYVGDASVTQVTNTLVSFRKPWIIRELGYAQTIVEVP